MRTINSGTNGAQMIPEAGLWGARLRVFDSLPSTNKWAIEHIEECLHGDIIRAVRQTAGHGRFGRAWAAPEDTALTVSLVLKKTISSDDVPKVTQIAAIAVAETLARHGINALLRWPNDALVGERKIAGILAEQTAARDAVALGIGLNVNTRPRDFERAGLKDLATSMFIVAGRQFDPAAALSTLTEGLESGFENVKREGTAFIAGYWERHDALKGALVEISAGDSMIQGRYAGMNKDGRLRLVDAAGAERLFWSGDVRSVKRPAGP